MVGWIILCIILLVLVLLLLIPVRLRFSYERDNIEAGIRYGPLRFQLYPQRMISEAAGTKAEKKRKEKSKKKRKQKSSKSEKNKPGINKEQITYSIEKLPPILIKALRRTGRRVLFQPMKIYVLIATPDPADTALLYGKLEAALSAGLPVLHQLVHVKEQDIQLVPDFVGDRMECIADVGLSIDRKSVV